MGLRGLMAKRAMLMEKRAGDYVRYRYKRGDAVCRIGVTTDPARREKELQAAHPGGRMEKAGRRVTRETALQWQRKQIAAAFEGKSGFEQMSGEEIDALGEAAAEAMGGLGRMAAEMEQFRKDTGYLSSIIPRLREQSPDRWVAVYEETIVGSGANLKKLLKSLDAQGAPRNRVAIKYVAKEPTPMIV